MAEKVTKMKLKVDLQNEKCRKKVKKVLCKFPQIRDQEFDEKQNIVTIKVVCDNPEKIRDKLCCKGGCCIKSIEIVETPKPEPPPSKPKPIAKPPPAEPESKPNPRTCCISCKGGRRDGPCVKGCGGPPTCGTCCVPCFGGCRGPPRYYGGYFYATPVYDSYGGGRPCFVSRCDHYFIEENPSGCPVM